MGEAFFIPVEVMDPEDGPEGQAGAASSSPGGWFVREMVTGENGSCRAGKSKGETLW